MHWQVIRTKLNSHYFFARFKSELTTDLLARANALCDAILIRDSVGALLKANNLNPNELNFLIMSYHSCRWINSGTSNSLTPSKNLYQLNLQWILTIRKFSIQLTVFQMTVMTDWHIIVLCKCTWFYAPTSTWLQMQELTRTIDTKLVCWWYIRTICRRDIPSDGTHIASRWVSRSLGQ